MTGAPRGPTNVDLLFAERLRKLRRARGLTQTDVARSIGVTCAQVQKYEAGVSRVSLGRAVAIATTLGVFLSEMLTDDA